MESFYLSHSLSKTTPAYGGREGFQYLSESEISKNVSSSSFIFKMPNHLGTHIDFPKHFVKDGKSGDDYPIDFWLDRNALLIDILARPAQLLEAPQLKAEIEKVDKEKLSKVSALLVRTGFEKYRSSQIYWEQNPGFSPGCASYLKENTSIAILGMDVISLTSFQHREVGREAHKAFLGSEAREPILLLEDMMLSSAPHGFFKLSIHPLRIAGADGAPCTVIGTNSSR